MIDRFYTPETGHLPLSNFSPSHLYIQDHWYDTIEHWYQAMKTLIESEREAIRSAPSPGVAKRLGRRCQLRLDWEAVRIPVMRFGLKHKFRTGTSDGQYLLGTGDQLLVEGNDWKDRFWGVDGTGENWLGHLLMARRAELRSALLESNLPCGCPAGTKTLEHLSQCPTWTGVQP